MKDLQEMNLVDDFLVNSLASHKIYDPFDRDRMVYTIRNCCVEEPDLPYEDGAETLFLYTKGTKGDPPQELRELLRYMEDSTEENARSEGLKALHRMVTEVKRDGEVGFAYMKSFEREQRVREEARCEGLSEGLDRGRTEGFSEGKAEDLLPVYKHRHKSHIMWLYRKAVNQRRFAVFFETHCSYFEMIYISWKGYYTLALRKEETMIG